MLRKLITLTVISSISLTMSAQKILDAKDAVKEMDKKMQSMAGRKSVASVYWHKN